MSSRIRTNAPPIQFQGGNQIGTPTEIDVDVDGLAHELKSSIKGEVRFDAGSRALYSMDASNYRQVPIGVVIPKHAQDIIDTLEIARKYGAPIVARGGGTSIPGQSCNVALMLDFSKYMSALIEIDASKRIARVQPGIVYDTLKDAAELQGLTFGPNPATHDRCTLGGMIGNNSCGSHSVIAGRTADNVEELEIITYKGLRMKVGKTNDEELDTIIAEGGRRAEIYRGLRDLRDKYAALIRERYPNIPRRVSGYNLDELLPENGFNVARALVGSECTCALILEATVNLIPNPPVRSLLVIGFPDVYQAGDFVPRALESKPMACEGMTYQIVDDMAKKGMRPVGMELMPEGKAWLLLEFGGETKEEVNTKTQTLSQMPDARSLDNPAKQKLIWKMREQGLGATAKVPGEKENWEGWEDAAVPPSKVGAYLRDFHALMAKYGYRGPIYGHFGDGCIHTRIDFDLETAEGIANYRSFVEEGADLVVRYGGSLTGEHGDGQAKGELLTRMYGPELIEAFREFKSIWDLEWKMNPGKLIAPNKLDENIKVAPPYTPPKLNTHFHLPDDRGDFAAATRRCVGAGVCRRKSGGVMCPSYMVTLEEKHSTRGRARLLFEMLEGDPVKGGWKSEEVKDALDLCLSCKGCKGECPVQVDMATYKSEFLSHYYQGRMRPLAAYAFGFIHSWAKIASLFPAIANFKTQTPLLRDIVKAVIGVEPKRRIPIFAPYTFKQWFRKRVPHTEGKQVILWPDTFNNHFHPTIAQAAVEVLECAGFNVQVPMRDMCCGRPLYDYGFLDTAKKWLRTVLDELREPINNGTPIVVLEPSCASVFRDELINLFPHDERARRLSKQVFLLSDFLESAKYEPPPLTRKALVQGHCHHKSLMKMDDEESVMKKIGLDYEVLDSGCCGMAGAFGFEKGEHYDVSVKCAERVLLPAIRNSTNDTLIIADGFSCREQIAQLTDRTPVHLAQVLQMALRAHPARSAEESSQTAKSSQ